MRTERIGFALCGSFCNHPKILMLLEEMAESFEMVPILSENTARYDTRFGLADDLIARVERAAGRPAIRTIVERTVENIERPEEQTLLILHADVPEEANRLAELLRQRIPTLRDIRIQLVGPVIGAHCGPGTLACCFMGKERKI